MTRSDATQVVLSGIDGANPLGFLAALGTLVTLVGTGERTARLRFQRGRSWIPVLEGLTQTNPERIAHAMAVGLQGDAVAEDADNERAAREREFGTAKKRSDDKAKELKKRKLKGKERELALEQELAPLEAVREEKRARWLEALSAAVPRPELALGKKIDCTDEEYRTHALALAEQAGSTSRESLDLLAAFGTDACLRERSDQIEPTPFCFITGSGQQFFLDTVRQLMTCVTPERLRETLFEPWAYRDEKLSMRWDPLEDRRYALMDRDPTASDNKSRTVWMANLLGYRALTLFPSAPLRKGLGVTAWTELDDDATLTWPLWTFPATPDVVRSLLQLRQLRAARLEPSVLRARGIDAVFRARRIKVGTGANFKWNFAPAMAVLATGAVTR